MFVEVKFIFAFQGTDVFSLEGEPAEGGCFSVAKSCPTLCDLMDGSPPGSSAHGILQTRILERVAISFSRESSGPRDQTSVPCTGNWQADSLPLHHPGSPIFTWTLANWLPLQASQQLVAEKRLTQPEETEKSFQGFFKTWSMQFYTTGINRLIFHWEKCVDCNGSYLD